MSNIRERAWTFDELLAYAEGLERRIIALEASQYVTDAHYRVDSKIADAWVYMRASVPLDRFDDICRALYDAGYRFEPYELIEVIDGDVDTDGSYLENWLHEDLDALVVAIVQHFAAESKMEDGV